MLTEKNNKDVLTAKCIALLYNLGMLTYMKVLHCRGGVVPTILAKNTWDKDTSDPLVHNINVTEITKFVC